MHLKRENNRRSNFRVQCNHLRQNFLARVDRPQQLHSNSNSNSNNNNILQYTRTHLQHPQHFEHNQQKLSFCCHCCRRSAALASKSTSYLQSHIHAHSQLTHNRH
ncbi:unnamed protein product [Ceratitis capitata]|uniref:(Mediterranean fruit fly) hypothetical protein n=1 Tax=Ceratitis capitata TaxID=7213 RepID=A0A811TYB1_CERCA|nr:unnamed protein product [Ceratitis capitata]